MIISAELIAIGILGVALVSFGWKVSSDIRQEFKLEIQHVPRGRCRWSEGMWPMSEGTWPMSEGA